ncbi:MAG: ABC transporter ATP-binding protein [Planctomycetes bacterium]|nr:ABC transporter ATP-binding protein [Planctomycetota bacterium]
MTEADDVLLVVRGVTKSFKLGRRSIEVLNGIDLDVREGDFVAIRGSSGAGKSTLLHILGLLDRPDAGTVVYDGRDVSAASEASRTKLRATEFAFVFQFYYLLPEFTALENVCIPAVIAGARSRVGVRGRAERKARAAELLGRVGLSHRVDHQPNQLSGGERQRVAIARALMNQPRIVFCDEPTGNLDSKSAAGIHALLQELNEELKQTIVVVTHEPVMASVARTRLVMIDGKMAEGD